MPDEPPKPAAQLTRLLSAELRHKDGAGRRATVPGWGATVLAAVILALVTTVAIRTTGGDEPKSGAPAAPTSAARGADGESAERQGQEGDAAEEERGTGPDAGPPYVAVPEFASPAARDAAFAGDVALLSGWPDGTVSYGAMSPTGGGDISDFRKAVVKDAEAVCDALTGGTDMNDVPDAAGPPLTDEIDQAAFIVEAVTFYCPDQMAAVTNDVYSKPVPVEQTEDCPTDSALTIRTMTGERSDDGRTAAYSVEVRNTSSYDVRVQFQQRWFADGFSGNGEWQSFGDVTAEPIVSIAAGEAFTHEGEQRGIYRWNRTEVRVQPQEFLFIGCGYQPGPGAVTDE